MTPTRTVLVAVCFSFFIMSIVYGGQMLISELPPALGWTRGLQIFIILCITGGSIGALLRIYTTSREETIPEETDESEVEETEEPDEE